MSEEEVDLLDDCVEEQEDEQELSSDPTLEQEISMNPDNPGWTNYVLSHLADDEMEDGYPKTNGLRRIFEKVMGVTIVSSGPTTVFPPIPNNGNNATVIYELYWEDSEGTAFKVTSTADALGQSLSGEFAHHPSAIADTRAEGRALRRAMKLNVLVKEEVDGNTDKKEKKEEEDGPADKNQINSIDILCQPRKCNLNPQKVVRHLYNKELKDLNQTEARETIKWLNSVQQGVQEKPEDVVGYPLN